MSLFKNKNKEQYQIVLSNDKPLFQPKRTTTTQVENQQYFVSGSMPVRRVYKIDISDIKAKDIQGYMRGVMDGLGMKSGSVSYTDTPITASCNYTNLARLKYLSNQEK